MKSFEEIWSDRRADVERAARVIVRRFGGWPLFDDLVSAGKLGLLEAYRKYDDSRGTPFWHGFAELRVRGAMYDELRSMDPVQRAGREAIERDGDESSFSWGLVRRDSSREVDEIDVGSDAESDLVAHDESQVVRGALGDMPPRLAEVVSRYYGDDESLRQIGMRLGVTEGRVCQLKHEALRALREALTRCEECGAISPGRLFSCPACGSPAGGDRAV